ncbi:MAG: hypothetical protein ABSC41_15995 [Acidimicrobiales bacterium]
MVAAGLVALLAAGAAPVSWAWAAPNSGGALKGGTPVRGTVSNASGVDYTFTGMAGRHVTLAITDPKVARAGDRLQINAYDVSGADLAGTTFSTNSTDVDFTPDVYQTGTIKVVISPYQAGSTGSFTLTYATDVTGALSSGVEVNGTLKYQGQHADYAFAGVAGQHVALAITNSRVSPVANSLQINAYNASGADLDGTTFNEKPTEIDFTPTVSGTIKVVIGPYEAGTTGRFTLTYATDVTGALSSGMAVKSALKYPGQHADYTFVGTAGQHVTLAITSPRVSPSGNSLQAHAYDASGADLGGTTFNTGPTEIDFTPNVYQGGTIKVVISPYQAGTTGSFTLTYAKDVTAALSSGVAVNGALKYRGQHADYTFTGVVDHHVTLAITNPVVSPPGDSLQINAYDASGAELGGTMFSTSSTEFDFTPEAYQAGPIKVVISPYQAGTTGSFTLTYATDVTGTLSSGVAVNGTLKYPGQDGVYTFAGVAGQEATLAITNPVVSPSGDTLQINAYDSSGLNLGGSVFNVTQTEVQFTPTSTQAGTINVVISPYSAEATGSFTLTYTAG